MGLIFLFCIFVDRFAIDMEKTVKLYNFSRCGECIRFVADADAYSSLFNFRIGHLGSYCALPDQVVQFFFLRSTLYFGIFHIGGADSFVSFLGAFGFVAKWRG